MKNIVAVFGVGLGVFTASFAGEAQAGSVTGTVAGVQLEAGGTFSFYLTGSPQLCTNGNQTHQRAAVVPGVRGVTAESVKAFYSTIMSALLAKKTVIVYTDETVQTTGWGCSVYAIDIQN